MNWIQIESKWDQFKRKAQARWTKLTDDDLANLKGRRDQLSGRIMERYGVDKQDADNQINVWMNRLSGDDQTHGTRSKET